MRMICMLLLACTCAAAQRGTARVVHVYAVKDLVLGKGSPEDQLDERLDALIRLLKDNIELGAESALAQNGGALIASATPAEQERIAQFLSDMRDAAPQQLLLEARFVTLAADRLPAGANTITVGGAAQRHRVSVLDEAAVKRLLTGRADVLSAPSVLTKPFQEVSIQVGGRKRFLTDYRLEKDVEGHPEGVVVPVIEEFFEGYDLGCFLMPHRGGEQGYVTLDLRVKVGSAEASGHRATPHGNVTEVRETTQELSARVTASMGQTLLFDGFRPPRGKDLPEGARMVVLVQVRKL